MKKILYAFAALAALTAVSCERNIGEPEVPVSGDGVKITVKARPAEAGTKTHIVSAIDGETGAVSYKSYWDATGESLGIFLFQNDLTASDAPTELVGDFSGESPVFSGSTAAALADGQYKMFLYSPYSAYVSTGAGFMVGNLKSVQNPVKGSFDPACDLMGWSDDNVAIADGSLALENLTLQRPMAILRINLYAPDASPIAGQTVTSFKMETPSTLPLTGQIKITTNGGASFVQPVNSVTANIASSEEVTVGGGNPSTWTDDSGAVYLVVAPVTIPADAAVTFTLQTMESSDPIVRTITASQNMALEAGKVNVIDLKIRGKDFDDAWYAGGTGVEGDPWLIATPEQMTHINVDLESGVTRYYKLIEDIDMDGITGWLPANTTGSFDKQIFFDGNNHTISNMVITGVTDKKYTSIFGILNGTVKNLNLNNCSNTTSENTPIGLVAGWAGVASGNFTATLENVHATNCTVSSSAATNGVGGLVGSANKATFTNCSFDGSVERTADNPDATKYYYVGGLVGGVPTDKNTATFVNCSTSGTITSKTNSLGGILGGMNATATVTMTNCSTTMTINANKIKVIGGLAGYCGYITFNSCTFNGAITATIDGDAYAGGILGYTTHWAKVYDCTTQGSITGGTTGNRIGGVIGSMNSTADDTEPFIISGCHSSTKLTGKNYIGGIIGNTASNANGGPRTITGCTYDGIIQGQAGTGGIAGDARVTTIEKCCVNTAVTSTTGNFVAGIAGRAGGGTVIQDCLFSGSMTSNGQRSGGIAGTGTDGNLTIRRCFTDATIKTNQLNTAGILGISCKKNTATDFVAKLGITVEKCIAWNPSITAAGGTASQWGSGAIVGAAGGFDTLTDNIRRPDMTLSYTNAGASKNPAWPMLYDQENSSASVALLFYDGTAVPADYAQGHYHGKAAAAGKTASQVASDLGWSTDVWDLTGSIPVLK